MIRLLALLLLPAALNAEESYPYQLHYHARFIPGDGEAEVSIEVQQSDPLLLLLDFNAPEPQFTRFRGDGTIRREGRRLLWEVPPDGGTLQFRAKVDHQRGGAYDARLTPTWAVLRLDDLFPAARVRSEKGAFSQATLSLDGPEGWSFETRYGPVRSTVDVDTHGRRFDRPLGWLAAGNLGTRRTRIGERVITITGPRDQAFRRMDVLVFLRLTLPELLRIAPSFPERVLVVGGSDDMWRGGLSGPGSLYMHPSRPLVSGNATSTLLHEMMHVATEDPPEPGDDWIVEGLAEYYSLVILLRTGAISGDRFERSFESLGSWAKRENGRIQDPSTGPHTARAVLLFRDLDLELNGAGTNLDAITTQLLSGGRVGRTRLKELTAEALGKPSRVLQKALE